ncbi:hypothetical protein [Amnibacterium kyonggiense]
MEDVDRHRSAVLAAVRRSRWRLRRDQHERRRDAADPARVGRSAIGLDALPDRREP